MNEKFRILVSQRGIARVQLNGEIHLRERIGGVRSHEIELRQMTVRAVERKIFLQGASVRFACFVDLVRALVDHPQRLFVHRLRSVEEHRSAIIVRPHPIECGTHLRFCTIHLAEPVEIFEHAAREIQEQVPCGAE